MPLLTPPRSHSLIRTKMCMAKFSKSSKPAQSYPPKYFTSTSESHSEPLNSLPQPNISNKKQYSQTGKDLALFFAVSVLSYIAYDYHSTRATLQQEMLNQAMEHQKTLALARMSFDNARKKRELQIHNERANAQKREMKMTLHIALLRKQLESMGVKPVEISEAVQKFEKSVKMDTSLSNMSSTKLWVVDDSDIKSFVPDSHDYDRKN